MSGQLTPRRVSFGKEHHSEKFNGEKENISSAGSGRLKERQSGLGHDVYNLTLDKLNTGASDSQGKEDRASVSTSISLNETHDLPIKSLFPAKLEAFWLRWVLQTFLHLESQSYVWPEGIIQNGQPNNQALACRTETSSKPPASRPTAHAPGTNTSVFSSQNSLLPLRLALRRVLLCLRKLFHLNQEAVVIVSPVYRDVYSARAVGGNQPRLADHRPCPFWDGDFDLLLIHRHLGLIVCDVRVAGDVLQQRRGSRTNVVHHTDKPRVDVLHDVTCVLHDVVLQLDAAGGWLSRVVSDVAPGLRIIKIVALPNLHEDLLKEAVTGDVQLQKDLSRCLEAEEDTEVSAHFITSDHMFDKATADEIKKSLTKLKEWWRHLTVRHGRDHSMTADVYKTLIARLWGAASTVTVPCYSLPRLSLEAEDGVRPGAGPQDHTAHIPLSQKQAHLLAMAPPKIFLAGPPGTGKSVTLLLAAKEWLRLDHVVCVLSTWEGSCVACITLHSLLQRYAEVKGRGERLKLLEYNFRDEKEIDTAVEGLRSMVKDGELYIVADEAGPDQLYRPDDDFTTFPKPRFQSFCNKLQSLVPRLHLWAASCRQGAAHPDWDVHLFTKPFRYPASVVREVAKANEFHADVEEYEKETAQTPGDPSVTCLYHEGQGHTGEHPGSCFGCGMEIAMALRRLGLGTRDLLCSGLSTSDITISASTNIDTPAVAAGANSDPSLSPSFTISDTTTLAADTPSSSTPGIEPATSEPASAATPSTTCEGKLGFRDILVICTGHRRNNSGVVEGLRRAGLPVRLMEDGSRSDVEDVATSRSDVVWVLNGAQARGLERKVVVCVRNEYRHSDVYHRLYAMSRCTSHLVLVYPSSPGDRQTFPEVSTV